MSEEFVTPEGATDVAAFLAAYEQDDNTFWRVDTGHIMNVLDEVLGRLDDMRDAARALYEVWDREGPVMGATGEALAEFFDAALPSESLQGRTGPAA